MKGQREGRRPVPNIRSLETGSDTQAPHPPPRIMLPFFSSASIPFSPRPVFLNQKLSNTASLNVKSGHLIFRPSLKQRLSYFSVRTT